MKFYQSIHQFYDFIFPYNDQQLSFVQHQHPEKGNLLEIGCGTGSLAIHLANNGFQVKAIDLEEEMIEAAKAKTTLQNPSFKVANMINIDQLFPNNHFDVILATLIELLEKRNFRKIDLFGNFNRSALAFNSLPLILSSLK